MTGPVASGALRGDPGTGAAPPVMAFVIPAVNDFSDLQKTVGALLREGETDPLEICVVSRLGAIFSTRARREFPTVTLIEVPGDTPIPQMRARAFAVVDAPLVAVIEDHVQVPPGWVRRALASSGDTGDIVAGPVGNLATHTLVDRAAFLCEYSHCLPPVLSGPSDWLPGNSVVYPRDLLLVHGHTVARGGWENELHDAMKAAGRRLRFVAELEVGHDKHYSVWEYFSQRYLYARSYAGNRVRGKGLIPKLVYAGATLLLPAILLTRIARRVGHRPEYRTTFLRALPLLGVFVSAWAAGEVVGYLFGPGQALGKVR